MNDSSALSPGRGFVGASALPDSATQPFLFHRTFWDDNSKIGAHAKIVFAGPPKNQTRMAPDRRWPSFTPTIGLTGEAMSTSEVGSTLVYSCWIDAMSSARSVKRCHVSKGKQMHMSNPPRPPDCDIGDVPAHMRAMEAIWIELRDAIPVGVGKSTDRPAFELLCRLTAGIRTGTFTSAEASQARQLMDAFGMTPSSRRRLVPTFEQMFP